MAGQIDNAPPSEALAADRDGQAPARGATLTLWALVLIAVLNILDRKIIVILQEPLKRDLGLSDTQLGLLTGMAFAIVYVTVAFPFARYAERATRKHIIAGSLVVWSLLTAVTGLAQNFAHLVALRMGVAAGEAGSSPASHSMISDMFPPDRRVSAFALWSLAVPVGTMLGYGCGGLLYHWLGWRGAMIAVGLFGIAIAPLVLLLREPKRGAFDNAKTAAVGVLPARQVMSILWKRKSLRYLLFGIGAHAFVLYIVLVWSPPFYIRVFGVGVAEISFYLAIVAGLAGGIGVWLGGWMARRLGAKDRRWYVWIPAIADLVIIPLSLVQFFVPDPTVSLVVGTVNMLVLNLFIAITLAHAHFLVVPRMRATVSAAMMFTTSVLGSGLAPVVVGFVSDMLIQHAGVGDLSLRYSMLLIPPVAILASVLFFRSAKHFPADFDPAEAPR